MNSTSYDAPRYTIFFLSSRHFLSLRSKYSQQPVLKHPQSVFFPQRERPNASLHCYVIILPLVNTTVYWVLQTDYI